MSARPATIHSAARGPARDLHVAGSPLGPEERLAVRAERVAAIAARYAAAVDHDARVPAEAIAAARAARLFGAAIPTEFGGEGATIGDIVDVCYTLGRACASTAMIFAMHQTKVACIVRHGHGSAWHQRLMRQIAGQQLLLASSTTEGHRGGDLRNSAAPIETHEGGRIKLERMATVISYGEAADAIVTTARRSPDAASADQVLVVFLKNDYTLDRQIGWDALGMRGTASSGYKLIAAGVSEQVLPASYDEILAHTMMPVAHLTWSAAWTGIAAAAVDSARAFVRKAAHRADATMPPGAGHLTRAGASMRTLRSVIAGALQRFELAADPVALESVDFQIGMNLLKVQASELAVATVMSAMQACGLSGYRNDSDYSIGRHLRDVLSSPIMISNDRIIANVGTASLLIGAPASLRE
jgi:acyl-CoA dehydrogenase